MAKISIELPEKILFSTKTYVRISDINYGGHVGNDTILSFMHEARVRYFKFLGHEELNSDGFGVIMNDVGVIYKSELFQGDKIEISIGTNDFSSVGFDMIYQIKNIGTDKVVAVGKTGLVYFDYNDRKVARLPDSLKNKLQS